MSVSFGDWMDFLSGVYTEAEIFLRPLCPEMVVLSCFECGQAFQCVAGDGERFCSNACEGRWCSRALTASQVPPTTDTVTSP